jgi:hypothetical protein
MGWLSNLFGFGGDSQQRTQTTIATSKLPEEIAPHTKRVLAEQEELYDALIKRGYDPYPGDVFAPFTEQQEQAMQGISGLVGGAKPYFEEALDIYRTGAEKFTPEAAKEYMSPYQRAVTDIEKREAQKVFERDIMPRFEQQAVQAGGMSGLGSRAAIQAGQLGQAQMQQMGDIEAKGLQRAYMDAQRGFAEQKARERAAATDIARTGPEMLRTGLTELGALETVGEKRQEQGQNVLDEAYSRYLEEQQYPQKALSEYAGMVYGSPYAAMPQTTTTGPAPYQPSLGQTLLGAGVSLGSAALRGGYKFGRTGGGLSDLPVVRRQSAGMIGEEKVTTPETVDPESLRGIYSQLQKESKAGESFYGLEEPKASRVRVAEQNKEYMDLIENIYPESKNEFLADALESLGAMILASPEKKGEAFSNRLSELQKAGIKRRDAMRVLKGKAGLKALESKHELEESIRQLPAVMQKRARATASAALEARLKEAKIKELERGPGAKRAPTKIDDNTRMQVDSIIEAIANKSFIGKKETLMVGDKELERNKIGEILKDLNMKAVRGIASEAFEKVRIGEVDDLTEGVMKIIKERIDSGNLPTKTSFIEDIKSALSPG